MAYVSLEEANEYFSSRLHADAWAEAADADRFNASSLKPTALTFIVKP